MEEEFIKESHIKDKTDKQKEDELLCSILKTRKDLNEAHKNFEFAEDDLIDYYSYQIKANQAKLDYLTKKAKSKGLMLDMLSELSLKLSLKENKAV